jgi:opacity protein-like surface antigen
MYKCGALAAAAALVLLVAGLDCAAADTRSDSRFALKLSFGASAYPSDQDILGGPVTAIGDSPSLFDAKSDMIYHFDRKFGRDLYGALSFRATENLELELGFGYRDLQLEITQHNEYSRWGTGSGGAPVYTTSAPIALDTQKDNDFSIATIRPGVTFALARGSSIVPYLSAGLDVMIVRAKTTLDFLRPYVTEDPPGHFNLFAGTSASLEKLDLDASDVRMGLDVGSGLEFEVSRVLSFSFGVSYLIQFGKAFRDFGSYVEDDPADPAIRSADYRFDGMNLTNVTFSVGMIVRL